MYTIVSEKREVINKKFREQYKPQTKHIMACDVPEIIFANKINYLAKFE